VETENNKETSVSHSRQRETMQN